MSMKSVLRGGVVHNLPLSLLIVLLVVLVMMKTRR